MREHGVRAQGVSAVDFRLREAFHTIWIYRKKGRILLAVAVASEISRNRNHHESGDADSLISLFPRPFYTQESNGDLTPSRAFCEKKVDGPLAPLPFPIYPVYAVILSNK